MSEFDPTQMGRMGSHVCGDNVLGNPLGCGEEIREPDERGFRCTDCGVLFHRHCALKHFDDSQSDQGKIDWGERIAGYIERGIALGLTLADMLDAVRCGAWWKGTK